MKRSLFALSLFCAPLCGQEIPEPYRSIVDLPFDGHGWFYNKIPLERVLKERKPQTVIEVGSWLGCSTRFIASHLPDEGILYAVDTWRGSQNEAIHMQDPRLPYLYQLFLSNVKHAGLTQKIIPVRMESLEAAKALNVQADLIYLDGAHDRESVTQDIIHWLPHLKEGGLICGDDWKWFASVREAVVNCANTYNKKVQVEGNFWWFE